MLHLELGLRTPWDLFYFILFYLFIHFYFYFFLSAFEKKIRYCQPQLHYHCISSAFDQQNFMAIGAQSKENQLRVPLESFQPASGFPASPSHLFSLLYQSFVRQRQPSFPHALPLLLFPPHPAIKDSLLPTGSFSSLTSRETDDSDNRGCCRHQRQHQH